MASPIWGLGFLLVCIGWAPVWGPTLLVSELMHWVNIQIPQETGSGVAPEPGTLGVLKFLWTVLMAWQRKGSRAGLADLNHGDLNH